MSGASEPKSMKSPIEIHSGPLSMFGAKAEMTAREKGVSWKRIFVPFTLSEFYQPTSSDLKNLERWRQTMNTRESIQTVMGEMAAHLRANGAEATI